MCPRMRGGVCEVVGIEPEHIDCADKTFCYKSIHVFCRVYTEYLMNRKRVLSLSEQNEKDIREKTERDGKKKDASTEKTSLMTIER